MCVYTYWYDYVCTYIYICMIIHTRTHTYIYTCIHVVTQSCIYLYIHFLFKFMCVRVCMSPWWSRSSMRIPINQHFIRILSRYFWHCWRDLKFREISNLCSWTIRGLSRWNLAISGNSYTAAPHSVWKNHSGLLSLEVCDGSNRFAFGSRKPFPQRQPTKMRQHHINRTERGATHSSVAAKSQSIQSTKQWD